MNAIATGDARWNAQAKARSPVTWRNAINEIPEHSVRVQVACLVWWDYFSWRPSSDPWTTLNDLKDDWKTDVYYDQDKVFAGLMRVGYPEGAARRRGYFVDKDQSDAGCEWATR
jgi:hypothetical protein